MKFLEYTMSGAVTIASNIEVYNRSVIHGETGLLANSPQEFADRLYDLIKSPALRRRLLANAEQYVREERTIDKHAHEWREAIAA